LQTQFTTFITSIHHLLNQVPYSSIANMRSISIIAAAFGLFAAQATATIALGNNPSNNRRARTLSTSN
jgi:hypothetical protein